MNATFIVDSKSLEKYYENRDCFWQPLTLISEDIFEYIENTRNKQSKMERFAAYSLLFFLAEKIFGTRILSIGRSEFGKPFIKELSRVSENGDFKNCDLGKKIYFSISHSGAFAAVALSDEGDLGVDIQTLPDRKTSERIEERFLRDISFDEKIGTFSSDKKGLSEGLFASNGTKKRYSSLPSIALNMLYFAEPDSSGFSFKKCDLFTSIDNNDPSLTVCDEKKYECAFLKKWTVCEVILKCHGTGLKGLDKLLELYKKSEVYYSSLNLSNTVFGISVAKMK